MLHYIFQRYNHRPDEIYNLTQDQRAFIYASVEIQVEEEEKERKKQERQSRRRR